jgi:hypothetical protein
VDISGSGCDPVEATYEYGYELYVLIASRRRIINFPTTFIYGVTNSVAFHCSFLAYLPWLEKQKEAHEIPSAVTRQWPGDHSPFATNTHALLDVVSSMVSVWYCILK